MFKNVEEMTKKELEKHLVECMEIKDSPRGITGKANRLINQRIQHIKIRLEGMVK